MTDWQVLFEIAVLLRNTLEARGQEAVEYLLNDLLPKMRCPSETANQLIQQFTTLQAKDVRPSFVAWVKQMRR